MYNPLFPQNYQPINYSQIPNYGNSPNYNQQSNNHSVIWVQGIEGAKAHPVAAGQAVLLMDSDSNCLYLKSADQTGMPSLRIFDYKERTNTPPEAKNDDLSAFATKEDLSLYATKDELKKAISDMRKKKGKDDE
ncbi:MAG: hypothetical protein II453_17545 [Alphaproteobacteria bacterium]|nr:hypothetical protein [Alphaproteobacteria bacterium]